MVGVGAGAGGIAVAVGCAGQKGVRVELAVGIGIGVALELFVSVPLHFVQALLLIRRWAGVAGVIAVAAGNSTACRDLAFPDCPWVCKKKGWEVGGVRTNAGLCATTNSNI